MRFVSVPTAVCFAALLSSGAFAQTSTTTPSTNPPAATSAPAMTSGAMKKSTPTQSKTEISKACSMQADAQKLHGKAREKFRSDCKKNGGKA